MMPSDVLTIDACRPLLQRALAALRPARLAVVGDIIVDEFVVGSVAGISREAPVPVLREVSRRYVPGGAANTAANAASLGASVAMVGVVGDDGVGQALAALLGERAIDTQGVCALADRPTTTKTRISASSPQSVMQQIVCINRESRAALAPADEQRLLAALAAQMSAAAVIIISDYQRGVITPTVLRETIARARTAGKICLVDSEGDLSRYRGATIATPNQPEAEQNLGRPMATREDLEAGGRELLARSGLEALMITRGAHGMVLFAGDHVTHVPVFNQAEVFDVTGAGDTVVATLALGLASGLSTRDAMLLANLAASCVVRHFGTATVTRAELAEALSEL
jgi:rfaE bifunctional protein kinase chain/domain